MRTGPTRRIELVRQPTERWHWVDQDGKRSTKVPGVTATQIMEPFRRGWSRTPEPHGNPRNRSLVTGFGRLYSTRSRPATQPRPSHASAKGEKGNGTFSPAGWMRWVSTRLVGVACAITVTYRCHLSASVRPVFPARHFAHSPLLAGRSVLLPMSPARRCPRVHAVGVSPSSYASVAIVFSGRVHALATSRRVPRPQPNGHCLAATRSASVFFGLGACRCVSSS
jgi:hypothetical protein